MQNILQVRPFLTQVKMINWKRIEELTEDILYKNSDLLFYDSKNYDYVVAKIDNAILYDPIYLDGIINLL